MPITINCSMKADVVGGSSTAATLQVTTEAYDVISITVADTESDTIAIHPSPAGQVELLFITATHYGSDLVYEVDGSGTTVPLDAPLMLAGAGAASLLGAIQQIDFTNTAGEDVTVTVLVGRNVT